jgi:hypothetical protein
MTPRFQAAAMRLRIEDPSRLRVKKAQGEEQQ